MLSSVRNGVVPIWEGDLEVKRQIYNQLYIDLSDRYNGNFLVSRIDNIIENVNVGMKYEASCNY